MGMMRSLDIRKRREPHFLDTSSQHNLPTKVGKHTMSQANPHALFSPFLARAGRYTELGPFTGGAFGQLTDF